jgi:hypothetical protein
MRVYVLAHVRCCYSAPARADQTFLCSRDIILLQLMFYLVHIQE